MMGLDVLSGSEMGVASCCLLLCWSLRCSSADGYKSMLACASANTDGYKSMLACVAQGERHLALWLRGLMELCIYPPRPTFRRHAAPDAGGVMGTQSPVFLYVSQFCAQASCVCKANLDAGQKPVLVHSAALHGVWATKDTTTVKIDCWDTSIGRTSCCRTGEAAAASDAPHVPLLWSCADDEILSLIRRRDPSGRGLPSAHALRLLMALLSWNPAARPTPDEVQLVSTPLFPLLHDIVSRVEGL